MILALIALSACQPPADSSPDTADTADTTDTTETGEPTDCGLVSALTTTGTPAPGRTLTVTAVDAAEGVTLEWSVSKGAIEEQEPSGGERSATWTLPIDIAENHAVTLTVRLHGSSAGCDAEDVSLDVSVDWTDADRTVVVYDPGTVGSDTVASYYASFRDIQPTHLCPVTVSDPTNLPGAELPAFLETVQACIDAVGPQVYNVVPVWGVPYRVADRIDDIGIPGQKATVSVDALLAFGIDSATATSALYNPVYQTGDSFTGQYDPYVPFGTLRGNLRSYDHLYLVARIDGADAAAARSLVDRTAAAEAAREAGGLTGTVYVDANYGTTEPATDDFGSYDAGNWNMIGTRSVFEADGRYPVAFDANAEEFGTSPALLTCPDALYYAGWYSYYNYNDAFVWTVGAIGGHLDSCSACDIRTGTTWSAMALQRGITGTFGAVSEPYVAGMPEYDQFFLYLLQGGSFGEAAYESTTLGRWMMVWVGDPLYRPYPS